jgi:DMSO/TMAO reductase YedYZ molybdopterin-dependent catalytic subunit
MTLNRREWIAGLVSAGFARAADDPVVVAGKRAMILHNDRPEDLETPLAYLDSYLTPNDAFFVRQHLPRPPAIDRAQFRLTVDGMVSKRVELSVADLEKLPQQTVTAVIECAGNGRSMYSPKIPGIQWSRGAIGNAEWSGPSVADVLKAAGGAASAAWVDADGADKGLAATPDFVRSVPMKKAMHPATIVALKMNGQPLPELHGSPARLITPGWDGASSVKWLVRVTAAAQANSGFFMNPAYRYPKYPIAPGGAARPAEMESIEGMPVKSTITAPENQSKVATGTVTVRGFAWAGEEAIERVDVSTDGGSRWQAAELTGPKKNFAWRLWKLEWKAVEPGYYTVLSRATDTAGRVQPVVAAWNPSGYLWNAIDRIGVLVEKA